MCIVNTHPDEDQQKMGNSRGLCGKVKEKELWPQSNGVFQKIRFWRHDFFCRPFLITLFIIKATRKYQMSYFVRDLHPKISFVLDRESAIKEIKAVLDKHNPDKEGFLNDGKALHFVWYRPRYSSVTLYFKRKFSSSWIICKATVPEAIMDELRAMAGVKTLKVPGKNEGPIAQQPFEKKPVKDVWVDAKNKSNPFVKRKSSQKLSQISVPFVRPRERAIEEIRNALNKYGPKKEKKVNSGSGLQFLWGDGPAVSITIFFKKRAHSSCVVCQNAPEDVLAAIKAVAVKEARGEETSLQIPVNSSKTLDDNLLKKPFSSILKLPEFQGYVHLGVDD
jgi:hypothetical protein